MSEQIQPGLHLEADTLSAFAEGLLPPHEREAALAHLAVCGECREVLQLSLPPFEQLQPALAVPVRHGAAAWRWLWAGAAACAGVGLAAVLLLHHPGAVPAPASVARVEAPPALLPPMAAPASKPAPVEKDGAAPPVVASKRALKLPGDGVAVPPAPDAKARVSKQANDASVAESASQYLPLEGRSIARLRQEQNAAAPPPAAPGGQVSRKAADKAMPATPLPAAGPTPAPIQAGNDAAGYTTTNAPLPSHLPTASRYAEGKRVVAADAAGTVFLSEDEGLHWAMVQAPWEGRVVRVFAAAEATETQNDGTLERMPTKQKRAVFALTTASGQRWMSVDGKTWVRE